MADILRGVVTSIVDGDTFDLQVVDIVASDPEKYDKTERLFINSLSSETDEGDANESGYVEADDPENYLDGTPEEDAVEGEERSEYLHFRDVRQPEDLEANLKGREVICEIKGRTDTSILIADVTVL